MRLNLRWVRKTFAPLVPEWVKRRYRARLFGYGASGAVVGPAVVRTDRDGIEVRFEHLVLRTPHEAADDVRYHFVENADSVEEIRGCIRAARATGGVLFDVGAARGLFAAVWILAREGNRAVAFEPSPLFRHDLERLGEMNGLGESLAVSPSGVGSVAGSVRASVDADGLIDFAPSTTSEAFDVPIVTLDDEAARLRVDPDAIKVDVEGHELDVLAGAARLLARKKPLLMLELHLDLLDRRGERPRDLTDRLGGLGYCFETPGGEALQGAAVFASPKAVLRFVARRSSP